MNIKVANGNESGATADMEVQPDATGVDVLQALKESGTFGVNPTHDNRYVITVSKSGQNLAPDQTLREAGVEEGDLLTVVSSEHGFLG